MMITRKAIRRGWIRAPAILELVAIILMVILVMASGISARAFDLNSESGQIVINYEHNEKPIKDIEFKVYRIGYIDEKINPYWTETYVEYNLELDYSSAESVQNLAMTLQSYISRDIEMEPDAEGFTDENGRLTFEGLKTGMYLILGRTWSEGYWTYRINPMLITLPFTDENSELCMSEKLSVKDEGRYYKPAPKPEDETEIEDPDTPLDIDPNGKDITIRKVWDVLEGEVTPNSITVDVMRDGQKVSEIVLNKENGFKYKLEGLPSIYEWDFIESDVPEGYSERIVRDRENGIVNIINTQDGKEPDEDILKEDDDTITDEWIPMDELPDTGVNYILMMALMLVGVICSITGIALIIRENRGYGR